MSAPRPESRDRLPRVLYALALEPGRKFGSLEEQLVLLADAFRARGGVFLPLFISGAPEGALGDYQSRGVPAACMDLRSFRLGRLLALRRLIRRERIDVIHWNFVSPLCNLYLWGLSVLCPRLRHWFTDHNSRPLPAEPSPGGVKLLLKRVLLRRFDVAVCVSRYVQWCLEKQRCWSNLVAQAHFVNTDRFAPDPVARDEVRRRLGAEGRFVLLVVGQLIPEKGVHVAVAALASLPAPCVLWVVGAGPQLGELQAQVARAGLGDSVRILGLQANVLPYLRAADVFLCPSLWAEAAGLVNLEAQACGLPVVASRVGGIPEYVQEGRTGLLFEPGDAAALARQVRRLIDEPDLRASMAAEARAWALERFSPEARLPGVLDLYRKGACPCL